MLGLYAARVVHLGYSALARSAEAGGTLLAAGALLAALLAVRLFRRPIPSVMTALLVAFALALALSIVPRARLWVAIGYNGWPVANPALARALVGGDARLGSALRLIESAGGDSLLLPEATRPPVMIPADWPLLEKAEYAVEERAGGARVLWVRVRGADRACRRQVADTSFTPSMIDGAVTCVPVSPSRGLRWQRPQRTAAEPAHAWPLAESSAEEWPQYRADARRTATRGSDVRLANGWRARLSGPVRASASAAGDLVLIGMHGTGTIEAHQLDGGSPQWRVHAPNWIHQDVIAARGLAIAGFGDNLGSRTGEAPSGVMAMDVRTGTRLWTRFTSGSVMTSPVTDGSVVVAGTSHGELIAWGIADGSQRWVSRLPGQVTMAPPLLAEGTVYVAMDIGRVCAIDLRSGEERWCVRVAGAAMLGHSSPSLLDGLLLVTATRPVPIADLLRRADGRGLAAVLSTQLRFVESRVHEQEVVALDPANGTVRWRRVIGIGSPPAGHSSGTAAPLGRGHAAVVSPVASNVVALRLSDGVVTGSFALGAPMRGPAMPADSGVLVFDARGRLHRLDGPELRPSCSEDWGHPMDRAGPIASRGLIVAGSQDGWLVARPPLGKCAAS